jgi:tight adherence protein C
VPTNAFDWIRHAAALAVAVALGSLTFWLARIPPAARPALGFRGQARALLLHSSPSFALLEPVLCQVAGWLAQLAKAPALKEPARRLRKAQALHLERAGHFLGLSPDEYSALSLLSLIGLGGALGTLSHALNQGGLGVGLGTAVGASLPYWRIDSVVHERCKQIRRGFPGAVDLAALCVGAGLDFPGALRAIVNNSPRDDLVAGELSHLLALLDVGHTRRHALAELERRVPIQPVRDFVRALTQADEKGNPIHEALGVQATMNRLQRSVAAEEAAARAGVLMIVPMVLLLGCILLMLMGPFLVNGMGF